MATYKFNPANPRVVFSNPNCRVKEVLAGDVIECSQEFADSINAQSLYAGIDGAPALSLLNPPALEPAPIAAPPAPKPARKRRRKPKAGG